MSGSMMYIIYYFMSNVCHARQLTRYVLKITSLLGDKKGILFKQYLKLKNILYVKQAKKIKIHTLNQILERKVWYHYHDLGLFSQTTLKINGSTGLWSEDSNFGGVKCLRFIIVNELGTSFIAADKSRIMMLYN